jgi:signal transduction histidine kinase
MRRISVGKKLYISVLSVFLVFAVAFIAFQLIREKQYKVNLLENRLLDYNDRLDDAIHYLGGYDEARLNRLVQSHKANGMRVTLIAPDGRVLFDNVRKDYPSMANHATRPEVAQALRTGHGYTLDRNSSTLKHDYFYAATYYPKDHFIIRSALPYDEGLARSLAVDQHFIWFALVAIAVLVLVLYRFVNRLGSHITKLRIFASRADHNESLEIEDLADFPNDELGEIAERIIKIYKRLETYRKEQDVLKRQLTQNVAHELKTPVASIQGYLETILTNPRITEETKALFLQRCYAQSERLTALLRDISTLNRLDDAPDLIEFESVDISDMVKNIQLETAMQLSEREMTFDNQLPEHLTLRGNRSLLYSIFRNLTDNAIAYAGKGTTITLKVEENDSKWRFVFSDNGIGVAPEHLSRLFERFYRVDKGRSRKMGGTGLGLAIVKNAVIVHGGVIRASNNPDGGLRFDFTLRK